MSTFTIRRTLPHPPEQVWAALTRADLLGTWFMQSDVDLGPSTSFGLTDPAARGWSGRLSCRVTEFAPQHRLAYTADEIEGSSSTLLTWTLQPLPGGTELVLEHSGWTGVRGWLTGMALKVGWSSLISRRLPTVLTQPSAP